MAVDSEEEVDFGGAHEEEMRELEVEQQRKEAEEAEQQRLKQAATKEETELVEAATKRFAELRSMLVQDEKLRSAVAKAKSEKVEVKSEAHGAVTSEEVDKNLAHSQPAASKAVVTPRAAAGKAAASKAVLTPRADVVRAKAAVLTPKAAVLTPRLEIDEALLDAAGEDLAARRQSLVKPEHLQLLADVDIAQKEFCLEYDEYVKSLLPDLDKWRQESSAMEKPYEKIKGLSIEQQDLRRSFKQKLAFGGVIGDFTEASRIFKLRHSERLRQLAEDADMSIDALKEAVPLATYSREVLCEWTVQHGSVSRGSQPTCAPNYTHRLVDEGILEVPPGHKGRKAPTTAKEKPLSPDESAQAYDWVAWWLYLGGFTSADEIDVHGWTPLMHAVDSMTFSKRAYYVAKALASVTSTDFLNLATTGSQPTGYTALHFACDGSDVLFRKNEIVFKLIENRAEIEGRDKKGNTPFLHAAGSGLEDVCAVLIRKGANKDVVNYNGQCAVQKARCNSPSVVKYLLEIGCLDISTGLSGRTRTGISAQREARYASTTSMNSPYTSASSWSSIGPGYRAIGQGTDKGKK